MRDIHCREKCTRYILRSKANNDSLVQEFDLILNFRLRRLLQILNRQPESYILAGEFRLEEFLENLSSNRIFDEFLRAKAPATDASLRRNIDAGK